MTEGDWKQTGSKAPLGMWLSHRHRATVDGQKTPRVSLTSSSHGTDTLSDRGNFTTTANLPRNRQTTAKTGQK